MACTSASHRFRKNSGIGYVLLDVAEIIGALIVVRFKEQADMIASSINQIAGVERAVSRRSDHLIPMEDLIFYSL